MKRSWMCAAAAAIVGGAVFAHAADTHRAKSGSSSKVSKVNVVQSVDIAVKGNGTALPVSIASSTPISVSSLPAVTVSSLPPVTVGNETLDVNVVSSNITLSQPAAKVVTLSDMNGITISSNFVSGDIDCDGYSEVGVFLAHDVFSGFSPMFAVEFGADGVFAFDGNSDQGVFFVNMNRANLERSPVLGPRLRLRVNTAGTLTNVKAVVYLRP